MKTFNLKQMAFFAKISVFIAITAILFSGCTEEKYYECDHDFAAIDTYYDTIYPDEWRMERGADGPYFYAVRNFPEVDNYVIDNGVVLCYLIENGKDNILPYLRPWGFNAFSEPYSRNIRFNLTPGKITFIVEASDFDFPNDIEWNMEFKVVVIQNFMH